MTQLPRLNDLKRLRDAFPEPTESYGNAGELAAYQTKFLKWSEEVRVNLVTSVEHMRTFNHISNSYVNGGVVKPADRVILRKQMLSVVDQEIHELEETEPHWTTTPTFWVSLVACVAGIAAAIFSYLAWQYPKEPIPQTSLKSTVEAQK